MRAPPPSDALPVVLPRPRPLRSVISLAPMIDVLFILLVFFMVTSTYLDLDMIPAVAPEETAAAEPDAPPGPTRLIRIGADGVPAVAGRALHGPALDAALTEAAAERAQVLVLPSGAAPVQALVSVMDAGARAGLPDMRVLRLEAR
ncbi:biopolymer transporter ExbD [Rhodovulum sp. 12E13]|uniref:ExbD/TolR family protein n=1 Tax=Rhodovulum sp. 12E13 TaxID=2203891 RepID=UPI000E125DAA|nr:biopolymer transporter ExbD [Rhodovulum sp. 12E13]RDC74049.1 biopolymer transporter ExbD [Rhodovulum sp. 12E13]